MSGWEVVSLSALQLVRGGDSPSRCRGAGLALGALVFPGADNSCLAQISLPCEVWGGGSNAEEIIFSLPRSGIYLAM